jgi:hypothetical protein
MVSFLQAVFFVLLSSVCSAQARRNVTVDSSSPLIRYSPTPSWRRIQGNLDAGGEHMMTQDPNAYALVNFTCKFYSLRFAWSARSKTITVVSYWIMSARWPYNVKTQHTLDGNITLIIDLQDHTVPDVGVGSASRASSIVAQYIGPSELRHTIRISVPPRERYAVVDRLMYVRRSTSRLYLLIFVLFIVSKLRTATLLSHREGQHQPKYQVKLRGPQVKLLHRPTSQQLRLQAHLGLGKRPQQTKRES